MSTFPDRLFSPCPQGKKGEGDHDDIDEDRDQHNIMEGKGDGRFRGIVPAEPCKSNPSITMKDMAAAAANDRRPRGPQRDNLKLDLLIDHLEVI